MSSAEIAHRSRPTYQKLWIVLALLIPAALLGFGKSYANGLTFSGQPMTALIHFHSALMFLWILMLIVQAWLIRTKRFVIHRWIGRSSFVVAPLILLTSVWVVHRTLSLKAPNINTLDARFEIYDLMQISSFGLCWGLALLYRQRIPLHVRFMVSTVFAFASVLNWFYWLPGMNFAADAANIDNIAALNGALIVLTLLGLIAMDWRLGIRWSPFWLVTASTLIIHVGFFTFTKTDWWMDTVLWFTNLGL